MAVSLPNTFPTEVWMRIGTISSLGDLLRLSETCTILFKAFRHYILKNAEAEQRRMGIPFEPPFTFGNVPLTVADVLKIWRILPSKQCRAIRTRLVDQPLELYVNLNSLTNLLNTIGSTLLLIGQEVGVYNSTFPDLSDSERRQMALTDRDENLLRDNEYLPLETAIDVIGCCNPADNSHRYLSLIRIIKRKADIESEKSFGRESIVVWNVGIARIGITTRHKISWPSE